jgi:hypothetical protein
LELLTARPVGEVLWRRLACSPLSRSWSVAENAIGDEADQAHRAQQKQHSEMGR